MQKNIKVSHLPWSQKTTLALGRKAKSIHPDSFEGSLRLGESQLEAALLDTSQVCVVAVVFVVAAIEVIGAGVRSTGVLGVPAGSSILSGSS